MKTTLERFFEKVIHIDDNNCWIWGGAKSGTKGQYGGFRFEGKTRNSHIVIYTLLVGPVPKGLTLDHLCKNTLCQNPEHMEPVPRGVNSLRGTGPTAENARKTHCPQNHEYSTENTYITKNGYRQCLTCSRIRTWGRTRGMNMSEAILHYGRESEM